MPMTVAQYEIGRRLREYSTRIPIVQPYQACFMESGGPQDGLATILLNNMVIAVAVSDKGVLMTRIPQIVARINEWIKPDEVDIEGIPFWRNFYHRDSQKFFTEDDHPFAITISHQTTDRSVQKAVRNIDLRFKAAGFEKRRQEGHIGSEGAVFVDVSRTPPKVWIDNSLLQDPYSRDHDFRAPQDVDAAEAFALEEQRDNAMEQTGEQDTGKGKERA